MEDVEGLKIIEIRGGVKFIEWVDILERERMKNEKEGRGGEDIKGIEEMVLVNVEGMWCEEKKN